MRRALQHATGVVERRAAGARFVPGVADWCRGATAALEIGVPAAGWRPQTRWATVREACSFGFATGL